MFYHHGPCVFCWHSIWSAIIQYNFSAGGLFVLIFNKGGVKQVFSKKFLFALSRLFFLLLFLSAYSQIHSLKPWGTAALKLNIIWVFLTCHSPTGTHTTHSSGCSHCPCANGLEEAKHCHFWFHPGALQGLHMQQTKCQSCTRPMGSPTTTTAWWQLLQHSHTC